MNSAVKPRGNKSLVLVTGPEKRLRFGWWATRLMLKMVGLEATYITPKRVRNLDRIQGVIIGGGDDIEPRHYGFTGDASANYDPERDALEMQVIERALNDKVPLLGICRGAQLINVKLGGSLHQDIRPYRKLTPNRNTLFPTKIANVVKASHLHRIINQERTIINSLHNQAIDRIASPLRASAYDDDGFIQAIEAQDDQCILGVQWHPEYLPYLKTQRTLFEHFATRVRSFNNHLDCHSLLKC